MTRVLIIVFSKESRTDEFIQTKTAPTKFSLLSFIADVQIKHSDGKRPSRLLLRYLLLPFSSISDILSLLTVSSISISSQLLNSTIPSLSVTNMNELSLNTANVDIILLIILLS